MGAPLGPRLKPKTIHDDDGQYTVFTGKKCEHAGCGLQLTSRNRYGVQLLCLEHGREKERARRRAPKKPKGPPKTSPTKGHTWIIGNPEHLTQYEALRHWLSFPNEEHAAQRLQAALVDHELKQRLKLLLPWVPSPQGLPSAIPIEEPTYTSPQHRSTRIEFLADADHYGV